MMGRWGKQSREYAASVLIVRAGYRTIRTKTRESDDNLAYGRLRLFKATTQVLFDVLLMRDDEILDCGAEYKQ